MSSGRSLSSLPAPHCSVQSAAVAERERVSRLFAEAAAVLQGFQTDVLGFIDEGEATMLGRSQGDLRRQEEQRSRLSRARHNLSQVPEADSVSFLQVRAALPVQRAPKPQEEAVGGRLRGCAGLLAGCLSHARRSCCGQLSLNGHLSGTGTPGAQAGPGGGVRPRARTPEGAQLHQVLPGCARGAGRPGLGLFQPVGAAAGAGR